MPSVGILEKSFLGIVLIALIYSVYDRLGIQPFWDEPKIYLRPLFDMLDDPLAYFRGEISPRDRPIGLQFFYAPFLWIFGESMYLIRILSSLYFILGLWVFYLAIRAERLSAGFVIALFLLIPIVRVYIPQLVGDPQLFTLFSLYFYFLKNLEERWWPVVVTGFLAGLTREPALALTPATIIFLLLKNRKVSLRDIFISTTPALGLSVHLLRNFYRTGDFFHHVTIQKNHLDLLAGLDIRLHNIFEIFLGSYLLIPLLLLSSGIMILNWRKMKLNPEAGFALVIVISYLVVFSGLEICLPRYFLPSVPFFIYLLIAPVMRTLSSKKSRAGFIVLVIVTTWMMGHFYVSRDLSVRGRGYQDTLEYPALAKIHLEVIAKVKAELSPGNTIITGWPFIEILRTTRIGYGPMENFNVISRNDIAPEAIIWTNFPEQIPWSDVESHIQANTYEETNYKFGTYVVKLFLKKKP